MHLNVYETSERFGALRKPLSSVAPPDSSLQYHSQASLTIFYLCGVHPVAVYYKYTSQLYPPSQLRFLLLFYSVRSQHLQHIIEVFSSSIFLVIC
jgi:hypothetical protein